MKNSEQLFDNKVLGVYRWVKEIFELDCDWIWIINPSWKVDWATPWVKERTQARTIEPVQEIMPAWKKYIKSNFLCPELWPSCKRSLNDSRQWYYSRLLLFQITLCFSIPFANHAGDCLPSREGILKLSQPLNQTPGFDFF